MLKRTIAVISAALVATSLGMASTAYAQAKKTYYWVSHGSPADPVWTYFLAGAKPQAPRWMQRAGLEWLFRLATEPRRLWRRYASYPLFVVLAAAQILGLVCYSTEENS